MTQFGEESQAHRLISFSHGVNPSLSTPGALQKQPQWGSFWAGAVPLHELDRIDSLLNMPRATENLQAMCPKEEADFAGGYLFQIVQILESWA